MSTRCVITCVDMDGTEISVYRHSDGYPNTQHGVLATLKEALSYAWPLPRYEADDFAAAIVAAWKKPARATTPVSHGFRAYVTQGGNIRLMSGGVETVGDAEYHYVVTQAKGGVRVTTFASRVDHAGKDVWRKVGKPMVLTAKDQSPVPME